METLASGLTDPNAVARIPDLGLRRMWKRVETEVDIREYRTEPKRLSEDWGPAYSFFQEKTKSVEVVLGDGMLHKCYFPMMPLCVHLSEHTKQ